MTDRWSGLIEKITDQLLASGTIKAGDSEAYRYGVEVTLLKTLHFLSYAAIALLMHRLAEYILIFTIYYLFRRDVGGFHAKTRIGCYLFSCAVVASALAISRLKVSPWLMGAAVCIELLAMLRLAPVQNENRRLDKEEIVSFRRGLFRNAGLFSISFLAIWALGNRRLLWLCTLGLSLASFLFFLGKQQEWKRQLQLNGQQYGKD